VPPYFDTSMTSPIRSRPPRAKAGTHGIARPVSEPRLSWSMDARMRPPAASHCGGALFNNQTDTGAIVSYLAYSHASLSLGQNTSGAPVSLLSSAQLSLGAKRCALCRRHDTLQTPNLQNAQ